MKTLLIIVGVTAAALSSAQISRSGNSYLFRMNYAPGMVLKYDVLSTIGGMSQNGQPMKFTLPMVWNVLSVKNGVSTIDTVVGPISMGGGKEPMVQATKNRIQLDKRGRLVGQPGTGQQVTPALPEKPIRVGQSWSASAPINLPMQGEKKISATYTFKGVKTVQGKPVAELAVKTSGQANGTGTMLLLVKDGSLFRSQLKMDLMMTSANGSPTTYKVTADINRK